jgi:hypothetical protein
MSLLEFQRRMAADVMRPLTDNDAMQEFLEDGSSVRDRVAAYVSPNRHLTAFDRLEIYNRQYWFRVLDALREDFPTLRSLVGEEPFDRLARAYLAAHPSRSFTLRNLGSRLPAWLTGHVEYAGARADLALDVARLEWAYVESFDEAEVDPLSAEQIAHLNANSCIGLQPHLQLLALCYPVDDLVLAVRKNSDLSRGMPQGSSASHSTDTKQFLDIPGSDIWLAVHRYDQMVYYRRLPREEYALLLALQRGASLEAALESAFLETSMNPEEQAATVGEAFARWSEFGWLCSPQQSHSPVPSRTI